MNIKMDLKQGLAWEAQDVQASNTWQFSLSPQAVAACHALASDPDGAPEMALATILDKATRTVRSNFGMALIQGLPVSALESQTKHLLRALGRYVGTVMPQNTKRETLCEVRNTGPNSSAQRGYLSRVALPFHSDTADILGLLCIRNAKVGGDNAIVSSLRVHQRLKAECPELLHVLEEGFPYAYPENNGDVTEPIPVFSTVNGQVSCRYLRAFIEATGGLSDKQRAALDAFDTFSTEPGMAVELRMQPGDLLLLNNYTVLHSRTDFEDHNDPAESRLLYRLWLNVPDFRSLHPLVARQAQRFTSEREN